jgi:aminomethyltransferase
MEEVTLTNVSDNYAQIALQGPKADDILAELTSVPLKEISYYHFGEGEVAGVPVLISRTGYTGSGGFELYLPPDSAVEIWQRLMAAGQPYGLAPVGLGARDTLRLEKGYALYGHELTAEISPLEAGLGWIVKLNKGAFVGRAALAAQKDAGVPRRWVGLRMIDRGIPREGYPLYSGDKQIGFVTSGTMSPSLKVGIGLALVETAYAVLDAEVEVGVRNRRLRAGLVRTPFVE